MMAANRSGMSGRRLAIGSADWFKCCTATANGESPENGGEPVSMQYSVHPSA